MKFPLFAIFLLLTGCHSNHNAEPLTSHENRTRSILTLAMLEGTYDSKLEKEIFFSIENRLSQRDKCLVIKPSLQLKKFEPQEWRILLPDSDFIAIVELTKYEQIARKKEGSAELEIAMSLRIYDLRKPMPHCIAEEMISNKNYVPKHFAAKPIDYDQEYHTLSPYGIAHSQIAKDIVTLIEKQRGLL